MQRPKWTKEKFDNHDEGKGFGGFKDAVNGGNQVMWHHESTAICFPPICSVSPIVLLNLLPISVNFILNVPRLSFA